MFKQLIFENLFFQFCYLIPSVLALDELQVGSKMVFILEKITLNIKYVYENHSPDSISKCNNKGMIKI